MRSILVSLLVLPLAAMTARDQGGAAVKHVNPAGLSVPAGYSHVVEVRGGRTLYVSGQIAVDRDGNLVGTGDVRAQAEQVFRNLQSALAAAGATCDDIVKITVFMTDVSQVQAFRDVRDRYFKKAPPASSLVQVSRLVRPELLIEIEAVAVVE